MTGMQRAEEQATRNGIQALEMAFSGVQSRRQDVENTKHGMISALQGSDGGAFQKLLDSWDEHAEIISKNLQDMINQLNETLRGQGLTQGSSNDAINQAYSQSQSIFDGLMGSTAGQ
ncbi:hypothetical protein ABZ820_14675 [Streptomyces diacarni]|uniref:WXG100 family type VII secretion target n=1 Tax=Streptomyces diacarni TaxID=2800381 RepID=A0A367EVL1_9ACTN|nr:hypothetical protein [Streptomyces diacarni]RCG21200.1 hypothetical protein DTL70_17140 [Streptomyces diacarni]